MSNPIPENEPLRLQALEDLRILDTERQADFDALVSLARQIFDVPISLISLLDRDRQWFKAIAGLDINETEREAAFCNYTISSGKAFVVTDASQDERFCANRLVSRDPNIRFYAGVPLAIEPGLYLGSLCIIDRQPRRIDAADMRRLKWLGELAVSLLLKHKTAIDTAGLSASVVHQADIISEQTSALIKQKRILDCASTLARMGAWEMDIRTGEWGWSDGMYALHEVERGFDITFDRIMNLYPEPYRTRLARLIEQSQRDVTPFTFEGRMYTEKGNLRWVRIVSDFECKDGRPIRRFGMKQDITDEKTMALRIQRLAQRDDLTGLYNRVVLYEKLAETANKKDPFRNHVALFLCDLDGFKDVNDTHGHAAGDICLKRIARRVRKLLGSKCLMARIGGDEFAILIHDDKTTPPIDDLPEHIQRAVALPLRWKGLTFRLTCSIGVANRLKGQSFDPEELLREADLALYEAKGAGKNCHRLFRPALQAAVNAKFAALRDVRRALVHHHLELYYQPKVSLHDGGHTGFTERAFTIEGFRQTAQGPWLRPDNLVGGVDACRERLTEFGAVIGLMGRIDGLSEEESRAVRSLWDVRELSRIRSALLRGIRQRKGRLHKMKLEDAAREGLSTGRAAVRAIIRDPLLPNDWCAGPQLLEVMNETIEFARDAQYVWRKYLDIQSDTVGRGFWLQDLDQFLEGKSSKS